MTYPWNALMQIVYDANAADGRAVLAEFEIDLSVATCVGVMVGMVVAMRLVAFAGLFWRMRRFIY